MNLRRSQSADRPSIELTTQKQHQALYISLSRAAFPRGSHLQEFERVGNLRTHYVGVLGELAVAEFYGASPRIVFGKGDDGSDFIINSLRVQVKSCRYFVDPVLKIKPRDLQPKHCADIYILCCVEEFSGYVELAGWARRSDIEAAPSEKFRPHLPASHNLTEAQLHPCRQREAA